MGEAKYLKQVNVFKEACSNTELQIKCRGWRTDRQAAHCAIAATICLPHLRHSSHDAMPLRQKILADLQSSSSTNASQLLNLYHFSCFAIPHDKAAHAYPCSQSVS